MEDDYEEILSLPEGVFRVKYHRLSMKAIRNLRSRWLNDVFKHRRELADLHRQVRNKKQLIKIKEAMVNKLTEDKIQELIKLEETRQKAIMEKANQFLKAIIGEEAFNELETKGFFVFVGLDGKKYRIKKDGELQVSDSSYWYHCCYIEQNSLPLLDIIASVFCTVKHSKNFHKETRLTKTEEVVS